MKRSDISRYNRAVHSSTPILRAINLSIAVLLLAVLIGAYWFVWRALPVTSGELVAPITGEATIVRDSLGVPHITAKTWEDAVFLQGYATAQDRLWQMDAMRRLASGELSEVVGRVAFESDREARTLRLTQLADAQQRTLSAEARAVMAAYARGVNHYLDTHADRLPLEFVVLRYKPRPWRIEDTLLIGLNMSRRLTTSWREEIRKRHMLLSGDAQKIEFLWGPRVGEEATPGSNAWVVSGAHTESGKPILANDPHLEAALPSLWYMVHLKADDLDVTGASIPGVPAVIIGHNQNIAWGMTNLEFDLQDLVAANMAGDSGGYRYAGEASNGRVVRDVVRLKDGPDQTLNTILTSQGPLITTDYGVGMVLRWQAAQVGAETDFAFLAMNRAHNWEEFLGALRRFPGPPQNFVYADREGNIGYKVAGKLPVRTPGCGGDVPVEQGSGPCPWLGEIPFEDLPQVFNPESGVIVTANQSPFPEDFRYAVPGVYAPDYRAKQIRARLDSKAKWTTEEMLTIQKDVYSPFLHFLARQVVAAAAKHPPAAEDGKQAVAVLRDWNGQMEAGQAAPMVASLLYERLKLAVGNLAAPGQGMEYTSRMAGPAIERLLRERPEGWVEDYDQWLMERLGETLPTGEASQGSNVTRWDYGQYIELTVESPVLGKLPFIGSYFDLGPVPMSGGSTTVKQVSGTLMPSFRMVADMANLDRSLASIMVGQSAQRLSPHYADQFEAYRSGESFPMQFANVEAEDTITVRPQ